MSFIVIQDGADVKRSWSVWRANHRKRLWGFDWQMPDMVSWHLLSTQRMNRRTPPVRPIFLKEANFLCRQVKRPKKGTIFHQATAIFPKALEIKQRYMAETEQTHLSNLTLQLVLVQLDTVLRGGMRKGRNWIISINMFSEWMFCIIQSKRETGLASVPEQNVLSVYVRVLKAIYFWRCR